MNFRGKIIRGRGLGKTLGFPTLNLKIPKCFSLSEGVYACKLSINNQVLKSVLFFGKRKTFDKTQALEIHVLDKEIKNSPSEASFVVAQKIREIKKFESAKELQKQIAKDCEKVRKILK